MQYHLGWSAFLGEIPVTHDDMWRIFYNYYLNLIRDGDSDLQLLLDAVNDLDLWKNTIVIATADHGELAVPMAVCEGRDRFRMRRWLMYRSLSCIPGIPVGRNAGP